jgi:hypothetical protein
MKMIRQLGLISSILIFLENNNESFPKGRVSFEKGRGSFEKSDRNFQKSRGNSEKAIEAPKKAMSEDLSHSEISDDDIDSEVSEDDDADDIDDEDDDEDDDTSEENDSDGEEDEEDMDMEDNDDEGDDTDRSLVSPSATLSESHGNAPLPTPPKSNLNEKVDTSALDAELAKMKSNPSKNIQVSSSSEVKQRDVSSPETNGIDEDSLEDSEDGEHFEKFNEENEDKDETVVNEVSTKIHPKENKIADEEKRQ